MKLFNMAGLPPSQLDRDEAIRVSIVTMLTEAQESQSSSVRNNRLGVVRGLIWALNGRDIDAKSLRTTETILWIAGIPFEKEDDLVWVSEEWLSSHGLE